MQNIRGLRGGMFWAGAMFFIASAVSAATITGGTTTVTLDPATVTDLTGLGFTITPVAPSTLGGNPLAATFPITGGSWSTEIDHSGGLTLAKGGASASIEDFIINLSGPSINTITGSLSAAGVTITGVSLFDIGTGLKLTLASQLANDLSGAFGVPNLTGASIGTASIKANVSPEPGESALLAAGFFALIFWFRRSSPRKLRS